MKAKKIRGTMTRTRRVVGMLLATLVLSVMTSCEVVRTISNVSEYKESDGKNVIIETKTIESYVGSKQSLKKS